MSQQMLDRLHALPRATLTGMRRGVEKESLRTQADGTLASTPHPPALGSALTHACITTDFSESQLELVTGAHADVEACARELREIHQFVYRQLGEQMLWVGSMPCGLPSDDCIPIGRYGTSNVGRAKSIYRTGLGHRYGRRMQTISGIHYNWSMPGLSNEDYFGLIRNFRRNSFVLLVLFGASPAVCSTFVAGRDHHLLPTGRTGSLHLPYATSLRMGRLGYQSDAQAALKASYNSLESYAASLQDALTRPYPPYEAIGIRGADGEYRQLATSLLQIENEFYGTIRPKRVIRPGERPLHALRERGVEYVEVRCMDLDPFVPTGIEAQTMRFIDLFLLHCVLSPSPSDTPDELQALGRNQRLAAQRGREPGLLIERGERQLPLLDEIARIVDECRPLAEALDAALGGSLYALALAHARSVVDGRTATPSARVLTTMRSDFDDSYPRMIRSQSQQARQQLLALPWPAERQQHFEMLAARSLQAQLDIEAADTVPFEEFRQSYLSPQRLVLEPASPQFVV